MRHIQPVTEHDTIVALSTPPGRSALAVVRLSGSTALTIAGKIVTPWPLGARRAVFCQLHQPDDGSLIDRSIVSVFPAPRSYTGEDIVEFSTHGGHAVPEAVVAALLQAGAREAMPGEFTRRALLNGKLDLLQVEAIGDLIDATSDSMRRVALFQLDGSLSRRIDELRGKLLDLEALLAYDIDFPEEDHGPISRSRITSAASDVQLVLQSLLATAPATELLRSGAIVVIAGRPNVGKSSLLNALVGEQRAIVTDIPGTTRDAIEVSVQLSNWPVRIVDTAGLRATGDVVERLGIEVSERYVSAAHLIIVCDDDPDHLSTTITAVQSIGTAPIIPVLTKADQLGSATVLPVTHPMIGRIDTPLHISAFTRRGIPELGERVASTLNRRYGSIPVARPALTRARQRIAVERASKELADFEQHWSCGDLPTPVAAVHIRSAVDALDELIGAVDTEDVLGRVFATFCIGK
jgi:tRNA modification GTPase